MGHAWTRVDLELRLLYSRRPGVLDLLLACMISLGLTPGVALGAHIAHKVPADTLQLAVAIVLVLSSIILVVKIVAEEI